MKDSAPKADGLNHGEKSGGSGRTREGARPIRNRGYHRALKRNELWAQMIDMQNRIHAEFVNAMFRGTDGVVRMGIPSK